MKWDYRRTTFSKKRNDVIVFGLGLIPKEGVPEIKIRYNRSTKIFLGKVTNSKDVADFVRKIFSRDTIQLQESFIVLYLNKANEILGYYKHTIGGIASVVADVRLIYATALTSASVGIVLAHNHPSGLLKPSPSDIDVTHQMKAAGKILDIRLVDHLILAKTGYFSFGDEGLL